MAGKENMFIECTRLFKEILCISGDTLECRLACDLVSCIEKNCPRICFYAILKILYETVAQEAYYRLAGVSWDEFQRILSKRSREYASFRTWMISKLKNVDGVTRKKLLRTYLELSSYTHPSTKLYSGSEPSPSLLIKAMDAVIYMRLLGDREYSSRICSVDEEELSMCGFEKTCRQYKKLCVNKRNR